MDSIRDWVEACPTLNPEQKTEIKERLAFAKSDAESAIISLERTAKASAEKCREQVTTIEALEARARNAEARAGASELKENELRLANEKMTEQVKVLEERVQLRLNEQKDLSGFLNAKNDEVQRLRLELKTTSDALNRALDARVTATLEAESAIAREEALKAEVTRLRVRLETSAKQMSELQEDMNKQRDEMVETIRDRGMKILHQQMSLSDKSEELRITQTSLDDFRRLVEDQREKVKDLVDQLHRAQENSMVLENNFKSQVEAQRQLAVLYEENAKSSEARAKALEERGKELDEAFTAANEHHRQEVERLLADVKDTSIAVDDRETVIADLRKELDSANKLLEKMKKHGVSDEYLAQLSPAAAAASQFLKPNMSLTQIYSQYVAASDDAERLKTENEVLRAHIEELVSEVQAREPVWKEEHDRTMEAKSMVQSLSERLADSAKEIQDMKFQLMDARTVSESSRNEAEVQKATMKDLRNQVTTLTVELERGRGQRGILAERAGTGDEDIVTFKSVQELQRRNEELLCSLHKVEFELQTVKGETEEKIAAEMKELCAEAEKELTELREARERNVKMMENLLHQRDMFREIAARATDGELPSTITPGSTPMRLYGSAMSPASSRSPMLQPQLHQACTDQRRELEGKLAAAEAAAALVKKEYEGFREEHSKNLSLLMEENSKLREDVDKLRQETITRRVEVESSHERLNAAKTNMELYKTQLKGAEEHNKRLNVTVVKLEETIESMRSELLGTKSRCNEYANQSRRLSDELSVHKSDVERLTMANRLLEDASRGQASVIADLRALRADLESRDNNDKLDLRTTIASLREEVHALERGASEVTAKAEEEAASLREAAAAANAELLRKQDETTKLQETVDSLRRTVEELEAARADAPVGGRLEGVPAAQASATESALTSRVREYESELTTVRVRSMALQRELETSRNHVAEYKRMASSLEDALQAANVTLGAHRKEMAERIRAVEERLAQAQAAKAEVERENEGLRELRQLMKEQLESSENARKGEVDRLVKDLTAAESRAIQAEAALAVAKKDLVEARMSSDEVSGRLGHESQRRQELEEATREARRARDEIQSRLAAVERELGSAQMASAELKSRLEHRVQDLEAELFREKQTKEDDKLAYEKQLTELEMRIGKRPSLAGEGAEGEQQEQSALANLDESLEMPEASPEQLKQLIAYMKKERDVRAATLRLKEAEIARLQQSLNSSVDELNAAKSVAAAAASSSGLLKSPSSEAAVLKIMSITEHEAVMNKVHLVSALEDSNRVLRAEKDALDAKCKESDARIAVLESQLSPKNLKIQELETKLENAEFENVTQKAEVKKWQNRANSMAERTQKVNPQDLEKLVAEKDQLATERQSLVATVQEKDRELAEKDRVIQEKEKALRDKVSAAQQRDEATTETRRLREANEKLSAEVSTLKASLKQADSREESLKGQIRAVKQLARKYKESSEEKQRDLEAQSAELQKAKETGSRSDELKLAETQTDELPPPPPAVDPEAEARLLEVQGNVARLEGQLREKETLQLKARQMMEAMRTRLKLVLEHKEQLTKALQSTEIPLPTLRSEPSLSDADCAALWGLDPEPYANKINELKAERDALQKDVEALKSKGATAGPAPAAAVTVPPQQSAVATSTTHVVVTKTRVQVQPQVQQPSTSSVAAASRTTPTASIRPLRPDSGGPQPSGAAAGNSQPITGVVLPTIAEAPGASGAAPAAEVEEGSEAHLVSSNLASTSGANIAMISPNFSRSTAAATSTTTTEPSAVPGPSGTSGTSSPVPKSRKRELDTATTSSSNFGQGPSSTSADETQAKRTRVAIGPFELMPQNAGPSGQQSSETPPEVSEGGDDGGDDVVELDDVDEEPVAPGGADDDVLAVDDDVVAVDDDDDIQEIEPEGEAGEAAVEEGAADDNDEPVPIEVDDEGDVTEGDGVEASASAAGSVVAAVEDITSGQESSAATQSTIGSTVSNVSTSSGPAEVPTGTSRSSRSIYLPRNDGSSTAKSTRHSISPVERRKSAPKSPERRKSAPKSPERRKSAPKSPILYPKDDGEASSSLTPKRGPYGQLTPNHGGGYNSGRKRGGGGGGGGGSSGGYVPWHLQPDRYDRSRYVLRRDNNPGSPTPVHDASFRSPGNLDARAILEAKKLEREKKFSPTRTGSSGRQQGPGAQAGGSSAFGSPPFEETGDEGIVPSTPTLCPGRALPDSEIAPSVPLDLPTSSRFSFTRGAPSSSAGTSGVSSAANSSVSGTSPTSGAAGASGGVASGAAGSNVNTSGTSSAALPQALDDTRVEIFVDDSGTSGQSSSAAVADSSGDSSTAPQQEQSPSAQPAAAPQQQSVQPPQQSVQHGVRADSNTSGRRHISWGGGNSSNQQAQANRGLLPHPGQPTPLMMSGGQGGLQPPSRGQRARRSVPYLPPAVTRGLRRGGGRGRGSQGYLPGWN